jgi:hypothetical protein
MIIVRTDHPCLRVGSHSSNPARLLLTPASMAASATTTHFLLSTTTAFLHDGRTWRCGSGGCAQRWRCSGMELRLQQRRQAPPPHQGEAPIWIWRWQAWIWPTADLGGVTSTCSDGRWLLLPLCVADGGLHPRCLDLGLAGLDLG